MALGAVSFIFFQFTLLWFIYVGVLLMPAGSPAGKPPAWTSGEAEPWPTPGEKAAAELRRRQRAQESSRRRHRVSGSVRSVEALAGTLGPRGFASPAIVLR